MPRCWQIILTFVIQPFIVKQKNLVKIPGPCRPLVGLFMTERTRYPAPGFDGASAGAPGVVEINGNTVNTHTQHVLAQGDVVVLRSPGGGGYGAPEQRSEALAARDRLLGYIKD